VQPIPANDRQVMGFVLWVSAQGRAAILAVHTRRTPLAPDVDLAALAEGTRGYAHHLRALC